jgi:hypothetical protein
MTGTDGLLRRIAALEAEALDGATGVYSDCAVCGNWPPMCVRIEVAPGEFVAFRLAPNMVDCFPPDTLRCPLCGRQPRTVTTLKRDPAPATREAVSP